jgi:hypothetical protein
VTSALDEGGRQKPPSTKIKVFREYDSPIQMRRKLVRMRVVSFGPLFEGKFFDMRWFVYDQGWDQKTAIVLDLEGVRKLKDILEDAERWMAA